MMKLVFTVDEMFEIVYAQHTVVRAKGEKPNIFDICPIIRDLIVDDDRDRYNLDGLIYTVNNRIWDNKSLMQSLDNLKYVSNLAFVPEDYYEIKESYMNTIKSIIRMDDWLDDYLI